MDFAGNVPEWLAILQEDIVFVVNFKGSCHCINVLRNGNIGKHEEEGWPAAEDEAACFHC